MKPRQDGNGPVVVFIFRQETRKLSEEENKRRTEDVPNWTLEQLKKNRNFEPRVLDDHGHRLNQPGSGASDDKVIAFNFIEAANLSQNPHLGLRYGVGDRSAFPWKVPPRRASACESSAAESLSVEQRG